MSTPATDPANHPTRSTPDYAVMVNRLGLAGTVRVMKGDSPFPTVSPLPWLIVMGSILLRMFLGIVQSVGPARVWFEEGLRTLGWTGAFFSGGGM